LHDETKTWPMYFADRIHHPRATVENFAVPGHSNSGIFLDLLQDVTTGKITSDSVVYVGLTNMWRDATSCGPQQGFHHFHTLNYHSANVHYIDGYKKGEEAMRQYAEVLAEEDNWMLAAKNFKTVLAMINILERSGCEFHLVDIIFDWKDICQYLPGVDALLPGLILSPSGSDFYSWMAGEIHYEMSSSLHFYAEGYEYMANAIYAAMQRQGSI